MSAHFPLARKSLPGALDGPLFYAQLREDAEVELRSLGDVRGKRLAVVGSGGCTALALLAAGAEKVFVVDSNKHQNHMTELKTAAIVHLPHERAVQLIGGWPASAEQRLEDYKVIEVHLSEGARAFWESQKSTLLSKGALSAGRTERFLNIVAKFIQLAVVDRELMERMFAAQTLQEQRALFDGEWNTWRWRLFFPLLFNPIIFRSDQVGFGLDGDVSQSDSTFFEGLSKPTFAEYFRQKLDYTLTQLPTRTNHHLHQVLLGGYPQRADALPPYLQPEAVKTIAANIDRLELWDADFTSFLAEQDEASIDGFVLSNIGDWMNAEEFEALLAAIARTAASGAVAGFRNFLSWTDIPAHWRERFKARPEDEELIKVDRTGVQRRYQGCNIGPADCRSVERRRADHQEVSS